MESQLSQVVDALPGLVWTAQPDGEVDFVNQRWREYTGISSDDAAGWAWQSAIHPDDLPGLLDQWRFLLQSSKPGEFEVRLRRFDGIFRWFLIRVLPSRDEHGQVLKWYGQNVDIEDRKRAESLLTGEKRLLEMVARGCVTDRRAHGFVPVRRVHHAGLSLQRSCWLGVVRSSGLAPHPVSRDLHDASQPDPDPGLGPCAYRAF